MQVDFYQLSRDPVEQVLPAIAEKLLEAGQRLLVIDRREGALDRLSRALWDWKPDSFLAHGLADGEGAAEQPILLAAVEAAANGARNVALTDGRWRDSALDFDRAFYFFDDLTIEAARDSWRDLKARDGVNTRFWRQEGRKWVQGP
ncbi:MAG: DNA polymerase III subunit chi [Sphingobium sp.]